MSFKATKEGFEQARQYAESIGKIGEFDSIPDSYLQIHKANQWLRENQEKETNSNPYINMSGLEYR